MKREAVEPSSGGSVSRFVAERQSLLAYLSGYFWFIFKNVIGWVLILAALPVGIILPGPGGIPIFLVGFALVTFPGKRRLTSRVMSGRGLPVEASIFTFLTALIAVGVTCGLMWMIGERYDELLAYFRLKNRGDHASNVGIVIALFGAGLIALLVTWITTRLALQVTNFLLKRAPVIRRRIRPWLKRRGINLLPSRRKRQGVAQPPPDDSEIIGLDARHHDRMKWMWSFARPWLKRMVIVAITMLIFWTMARPLVEKWPEVRTRIAQVPVWRFVVASGLFAFFLFAFRAMSWRRMLKAFGHKLPPAVVTRIWATSELARYLPGSVWQVIGRVYLIRPYGVSGSVCSTTQVLELCVFLLANVLVAVACLLWFAAKLEPTARPWLYTAMALVPLMSFLLHPKVFYGITNRVLGRLGKPKIVQRLRGRSLVHLLGWLILGLLVQSAGVYLITAPALGLKPDWWWYVAGAYCLAWIAGFLAFWAPGGLGVRELVFVATLQYILPDQVKNSPQFSDPASLAATLVLLGFILRLWTIVGELIVTVTAYAMDLRGALGFPDAPGRVRQDGEYGGFGKDEELIDSEPFAVATVSPDGGKGVSPSARDAPRRGGD
jgi:uncharacterized membrane protein YbhN (UPF0104 family)